MSDQKSAGIAAALREGVTALSRHMRAARPAAGLSATSLIVLSRLHRGGEMTPTLLASLDKMQPQSLTRVLAALEERELIRRVPDPTDGRRVPVRITQAGRLVLREDSRLREAWLSRALEKLSPTEREVLRLAADLMQRMAAEEVKDA
ncbi:MAG TPA: MarR family transcriptional regulator [Parvibaculum sp.]